MGATCWPDVPGRDRQECGGPGAPGRPRPRHAGPAPARTRQARRARTLQFTFWRFQSRVQGRGWPEPDLPPGPAVVPAGPTLSASASARGWSPGSGTPESPASSAPSRERASGQAVRGGQPPTPWDPHPTHLQQQALLLLALQLLPDVGQLPPADGRPRGRGGLGRLRAATPSLPSPSPLTPAAPPSAPATSLKSPSRPVAS